MPQLVLNLRFLRPCRRTMLQRYKRPASWELIERVARMHSVPVVGNGDVLTHYEARRRMDSHGCHAVMVGRCVCVWLVRQACAAVMRLAAHSC